jgi:thioredoxin 1
VEQARAALQKERTIMASANVVTLTSENWDQEVIKSDKPVLVDFWAVYCGPCRLLAPTIDKVADEFGGRVKVGKLDTEESPEIAMKYRITAIPQVMVFKGGEQPVERPRPGVLNEAEIAKMLNRVLDGANAG